MKVVSFCSNHILGTALPPPSVGGLRRKGPVTWPFVLPRPAPSRRPRAVSNGCGEARRRARAGAHTIRSTDLQFVPVLTSFIAAARASFGPRPSSPFGIRRGHHSSSTGSPRCSGPVRSPSERSPGLPSSPSAPRHEVPGFGAIWSLVRLRVLDSRAGAAVDLRSSARAGRRWLDCRRLRSLLAANQWIAEISAVVETDPERSESPFTPHRVPRRAWSQGEADFVEGRESVESREIGGDLLGTVALAGSFEPAGRRANEEASRRGGDRAETSWRQGCGAPRPAGAD